MVAVLLVVVVIWRMTGHQDAVITAELPTAEPVAAQGDTVIVEPNDGMAPIYSLLSSPSRSLDMTMYELVDSAAEEILAADEARGVRVRVVLDHRLEAQHNTPAYEFLRSQGITVAWSSTRFFATHEKAFVIDDHTAVVMSLNLTDQYYATTRDLAVVDHDPRDVAAVESVFGADLRGGAIGTPAADDLVWSPGQSDADLVALIDSARSSLAMESEELSSRDVIAALVRAARRGVRVDIAMTYQSDWRPGLNAIAVAGGTIGLHYGETPIYIHAKLFAIDVGTTLGRAFIGSENLSDASLLHDRELGIVLLAPTLVDRVASVIAGDVSSGQRWH
jgi:cardiolipin synthase A/B